VVMRVAAGAPHALVHEPGEAPVTLT